MDNEIQELKTLLKKTGSELFFESYEKALESLIEAYPDGGDLNLPAEIWAGVAQALADNSGFHVALKAQLWEENTAAQPIRLREFASFGPTIFSVKYSEDLGRIQEEVDYVDYNDTKR